MSSPINSMIDAAMRCLKCGTQGMWNCDCHVQCSCGWIADKGQPCNNPETRYCSTKLRHAAPRVEMRKGDRVVLTFEVSRAAGFIPCDAQWSPQGYCGTVAATPRAGRETVSIRWDGRAGAERIRIGWLEKLPVGPA